METKTGIYWGRVMHHRFSPRRHHFTYPVFIFALDLDEVEAWDRRLRLFGHNRFSLYSLRDRDHGRGEATRGIKADLLDLLRERGFRGKVDRVMMVTQFRALGYLFNPVTFYYCYADGRSVAFAAEVNNTFHQRYTYTFFGDGEETFHTEKIFYVSPFVDMGLEYRYRFAPLGRKLGIFIDDYRGSDPVLKTHIVGDWTPLSDWGLLKSFLRIPFMSAWIIAWIHWEAMKLWFKRIPVVFRPWNGMKPGWRPGAAHSGGRPA